MKYLDNIKTLKRKKILFQMEFAEKLGVSFSSVNRWETCKHDPTIKLKRKLVPIFYEI